jgi:hypothetical protein
MVSLIGTGSNASIEGIGAPGGDEGMSSSSTTSSLRGAASKGASCSSTPAIDDAAGLVGTLSVDNLRFLGLDDDVVEEVAIGAVFDKFNGVDSSSGLKSSSSSTSSAARSCCGFRPVPNILDSRALLLKFPIFNVDAGCAGVPRSVSNPMLLDLALGPRMLGCLARLLKFPIERAEIFLLAMLGRLLLSVWFVDSTLLDRAR